MSTGTCFQDVYERAGQVRTVDIAKGEPFLPPEAIGRAIDVVAQTITSTDKFHTVPESSTPAAALPAVPRAPTSAGKLHRRLRLSRQRGPLRGPIVHCCDHPAPCQQPQAGASGKNTNLLGVR